MVNVSATGCVLGNFPTHPYLASLPKVLLEISRVWDLVGPANPARVVASRISPATNDPATLTASSKGVQVRLPWLL